jgi:PAS domain S-box-containing protein
MSETSGRILVLHVDDDPEFTRMAATFLEREDARLAVDTATSTGDGLERLRDEQFDCVVSDYDMPGRNGIEFLEAVRDDYPDLPFVLYTGKGNEEVASDAIAAGVTDYLQKQTGTEQYELLANRVLNAVEQYRANQRAIDLQRVRDLVADINQALVRASDRRTIESRVCEILADAEPYRFAWIGEHDPDARTVEPRTSAGIESEYLDAIEITTDGTATGQGPTGRAVRTQELTVVPNVLDEDDYGPWRDEALERGYRSSAAAPLVYGDETYGVLNVYADRTEAFDERERELLAELADDVAQALHHQEVQRTLRHERDRFQHLVDGIEQYAIFMLDPDGCVSTWNPGAERIKGYTADEIVGAGYETFFPDEAVENERPRQLLARAEAEGSVTGTGWRVRKDGDRFWADFTLTALHDDAGTLRGFAKVTRDMTDQRRRDQELARQNGRLDEFASVVSHDLRGPLGVAEGRLELARKECESDHLDEAADAIRRSLALVEDVLTLAREGEDPGDVEPVDLADVVEQARGTVDTTAATVVTEIGARTRLEADRSRLQQLLENLVRNAIEHGGDDVTVTVGETDRGFYVADDGPGTPEGKRERVFEAGYSTADGGNGLGLDIAQRIADAHGWEVDVSEGESGGTRFDFVGVETA